MKLPIIYKLTNIVTGNSYIGQTTQPLNKRWGDHCSHGSCCSYLYKSIKKYGKDKFTKEILVTVLDVKYLDELEQYFIKINNTLAPNGYNLTTGGNQYRKYTNRKKLVAYNLNTGIIEKYTGVSEAAIEVRGDRRAITRAFNGILKQHKKRIWFLDSEFTHELLAKKLNSLLYRTKIGSKEAAIGVRQLGPTKFRATLFVDNTKSVVVGDYTSKEEAEIAYLQARKDYLIRKGRVFL